METAVNESLSDPKKTFDESCIQWICDENTIMKVYAKNQTNIRDVLFISFFHKKCLKDFLQVYEKEICRTYFAEVGTSVNSWDDCFKSDLDNFKQNNYTIHGLGKFFLIFLHREPTDIHLCRCIFQELLKFICRKYFLYS